MQSGLTGINALRIYNPIKQGQDHDPQGAFIRHWLPELRALSDVEIHQPWTMPECRQVQCDCILGRDYPQPIVDHLQAVRQARAQFSDLRRREDYWQQAQQVMQRHGSRKRPSSRTAAPRAKAVRAVQTELPLDSTNSPSL